MLVIFATALLLSMPWLNLVVALNPMTMNIAKYKNNIGKNRYTTGQLRMKTTKRVYLDTNVYCRPLDDQSDSRIHEEAEAFLQIADKAERGETEIVSSDYVKFEMEQIKDPLKRKNIQGFERILSKTNVTSSNRLINIAKEINVRCKLNSLDALHSAAAFIGKANFLLTCDDEILENTNCIETLAAKKGYKLKVRNPIDYVQETGE